MVCDESIERMSGASATRGSCTATTSRMRARYAGQLGTRRAQAVSDRCGKRGQHLRKRGNTVALEAANPAYETRIFGPDRVNIQGKLVGLIRKYT